MWYGKSITTTGADEDLFATLETDLGREIVAKKVQLRSTDNIGVCMNNNKDSAGDYIYGGLFLDGTVYSLNIEDVQVSSLRIETSGHTAWIGILFDYLT